MSHDILHIDSRGGGVTVVAGTGAGAGLAVTVRLSSPSGSPPEVASVPLSDGEMLPAPGAGVPALLPVLASRTPIDPTEGKGSGELLLFPLRANTLTLVLAGSGAGVGTGERARAAVVAGAGGVVRTTASSGAWTE